ncbi:MAG: NAD-dependent DNA ligase LigA [[Bacteroides] pectinophilus]|nr:NAD-dependent DNA ligase LigA [[Bacteroides] pectinophilus]
MNRDIDRIKELVDILNKAGRAYYAQGQEIMSNYEYDALYDELVELEKKTGCVLASSPTVNVGYEVLSELPKERHEKPMLSLGKTKSVDELVSWLGSQKGLLSWKMDGLTIVLTYNNGEMTKAVTRGNGEVGEVITGNAKMFANVPVTIPYKGELILRGEAVIRYSDFEKINELIPEEGAKYKNPRNLCSGSVRQLNSRITKERNVNFFAFTLVKADGVDFKNSRREQLEWLASQGFQTVEYKEVTADNLRSTVSWFENAIKDNDFPSDGLVILYDDIAYGDSLGMTAKFPRNSLAFKWTDETAQTKLLEIEWSASRTGLINPVAVFEPVELEGTSVSRASVHNISIMEELELGVGDTIEVYKANMIIPQIAKNLTRSGVKDIPQTCPVCGMKTEIRSLNDAKSLYCTNPDCQAKHVKSFVHFVARDAMNIDGLSEATLEKFIQHGMLHEFADLYHLDDYRDTIIDMDGFGIKSYDNMMAAIDRSRHTTLPKLIYSLGIANVGLSNARMIVKNTGTLDRILSATREELCAIDGVGEVIADSFVSYFADDKHRQELDRLVAELDIEAEEMASGENAVLADKVFVITGSLNHYSNRNELKELIEKLGGKVTGSVTGKTSYLINNDSTSSSSKNKTAAKLGIPVITEDEFIKMIEE